MTPTVLGYQEVSGALFAANYAREYIGLGFNTELAKIAQSTGGKVFDPTDIDGIVAHAEAHSRRIVNTKDRLGWPFVLAAVLIFLAEIFIRRLVRRE